MSARNSPARHNAPRRSMTPAQFQAVIDALIDENANELERTMSWHHARSGLVPPR